MKRVQHVKRVQDEESAKWKKWNRKRVQHGKCPTWTKYRDRAKFGKKCKRRVHYSAQTDNGASVTGRLNTSSSCCFFYFCKTIVVAFLQEYSVTLFLFLPRNIITSFQHGFRPFVDECFFFFFEVSFHK